MKLAVKKDTSGSNPLGGFHYMLHPLKMDSDAQAILFEVIGYVVFEVEDIEGEKLLDQARSALNHQVHIAFLIEHALIKKS